MEDKAALEGLDNAYIRFDGFTVPRSSLLSRFCHLDKEGVYTLSLPAGVTRMLDLLISRLLTGRIVLSEATIGHALGCMQRSWQYCANRKVPHGIVTAL